jgi:hypothetical protein
VLQKLSGALAAEGVSPSVQRVDAQMAARDAGVIAAGSSYGLAAKWVFSSLAITAALALAFALRGSPDADSVAGRPQRAEPTRALQPLRQLPVDPPDVASPSPPTAPRVEPPLKRPLQAARVRLRPERRARRAAVQDDLAEPQLVAASPETLEPAPVSPPTDEPAVVPAGPDLAEELRLLRSASSALAAHQPAVALARIQQHAARYPKSPLAQEAEALRVMALCELGEQPAARVARDKFLRVQPHSPLGERVRQACAGLP